MIYTKTGDKGTTSLVGGSRVSKCDPRVEAYGTVDELNSHIGLLAEMVKAWTISSQLKSIQNRLFVIQTLLATEESETYAKLPHLTSDAVTEVEAWIDSMDAQIPKLNSFVIAGGSMASAQAHVARTVCRRTERRIVALQDIAEIEEIILQYINRLSDYLFVTSRYILHLENKQEIFWSAE